MTAAAEMITAIGSVPVSPIPAVNVASVPQRSPLRYPGGKTWLVPHIRAWLRDIGPVHLLVEPFAGGGTASLTAVMEGLAEGCLMVELDADVAAFWQAALYDNDELTARIRDFNLTRAGIEELGKHMPDTIVERGFRTLALNRTRRGGILAEGAALTRAGENGKGVASRWYPDTISQRLADIAEYAGRIDFREDDGMAVLESMLASGQLSRAAVFADPPYTAGGKRAGRRLYKHNYIDHDRLFDILANSGADFLMTYDESPEVLRLIAKYCFQVVRVVMKNTHHAQISELVITNRRVFGQ